jgi:ribosomal protein L11 methyltransferase
VLLAELGQYAGYLNKGGLLLLSGFYVHDIDDLKKAAGEFWLSEVRRDEKEGWASLLLIKM